MDDRLAEDAAISKLKNAVSDLAREDENFGNDVCLLIWLKSQNMKWEKAEKMIRDSVKWRKEINYKLLLEQDFPEEMKPYFKFHFATALDGRPVLQLDASQLDCKGALDNFGKERVLRLWAQLLLKMEAKIMEYNQDVNQNLPSNQPRRFSMMLTLLNASNFQAKQVQSFSLIRVYTDIVRMLSGSFPSMVDTGFFMNVNKWMSMILKLFRVILESIGIKIEVYAENSTQWKDVLFQRVHPDQLMKPIGNID